mgnify:CR=1 FL=1
MFNISNINGLTDILLNNKNFADCVHCTEIVKPLLCNLCHFNITLLTSNNKNTSITVSWYNINGLTDILLNNKNFADCVHCTEIKNLHVLTCGAMPQYINLQCCLLFLISTFSSTFILVIIIVIIISATFSLKFI